MPEQIVSLLPQVEVPVAITGELRVSVFRAIFG